MRLHDAADEFHVLWQPPVEASGGVHLAQAALQDIAVVAADPSSGPLVISVPVAHTELLDVILHACEASLKRVSCAEAGGEDAEFGLNRADIAASKRGDCKPRLGFTSQREEEREQCVLPDDAICIANCSVRIAHELIDVRR